MPYAIVFFVTWSLAGQGQADPTKQLARCLYPSNHLAIVEHPGKVVKSSERKES